MSTTQLIARRASKGHNAAESAVMLAELEARHDGANLAAALVYEGFATENQARRYAGLA